MEVRSTAVRHVLYIGKLQAFHGRKYYQDFFFFKTQASNNNLHAVTWQSWIWIPYSFKSWVALYQIAFFISCIVRQLSFPCHNAFWHKSVQKNLRSSGGLLFHWAVKIMQSILARWFEDRKLNVHFVTSWRWQLDPLCTLHLQCSQPTLQACLGFHYSDGGGIPPAKSGQWSKKPRDMALPCPRTALLPQPVGNPCCFCKYGLIMKTSLKKHKPTACNSSVRKVSTTPGFNCFP